MTVKLEIPTVWNLQTLKELAAGEMDGWSFESYALERFLAPILKFCGFGVVARDDARIVGFTHVIRALAENTFYFAYIWIDPKYRQNRIATQLHAAALRRCWDEGARQCVVAAKPDNLASLHLLVNGFNWRVFEFCKDGFAGEPRVFLRIEADPDERFSERIEVALADETRIRNHLEAGFLGTRLHRQGQSEIMVLER